MRWRTLAILPSLLLTMAPATVLGSTNDAVLISVGKQPSSPAADVRWVFGGGTRELPVSFLLKKQKHLIVADLYLSGGKLGEPIAKGMTFQTQPDGNFQELRSGIFSLQLPHVEKPLLMMLIIRNDEPGNIQGHEIASIPLMVYPNTLLRDIGKRLADEAAAGRTLTLSLFGDMKGLRDFLRLKQVPFEDLGRDFPAKLPAGTVAVGDIPKDQPLPPLSMDSGSSLMVFHEDPTAPENITLTTEDRRTQIVIHHAAPVSWAEDPKAQKFLFDIIQKTPAIL
jgi:hypothetical protein